MAIQKITAKIIADGTIIATDIADGSITTAKIADANVTAAKIVSVANTQVTGLIIASQIAAVNGAVVTANTIANSAFQTGSVENYMSAQNLGIGMRNRIINGAMMVDQRNAGATVTPTNGQYTLDRWAASLSQASKFTVQQSTTAPVGFINSLKVTSSSAYTVGASEVFLLSQYIEGLNVSDLAWGTANAKTVTLSFQVYSSLTGTFGGSIADSVQGYSYPFTYTISSANTWTQISVTIAGPTAGTWYTNNGIGLRIWFGLGVGSTLSGTAGAWAATGYYSATGATSVVGTNGATWYITGVQLEIGSTATPFERRLYNQELANCQRYYAKSYAQGTVPGTSTSVGISGQSSGGGGTYTDLLTVTLPVIMRTTVSVSFWDTVGNASKITRLIANTPTTNSTGSSTYESDRSFTLYGTSGVASANGLYAHWVASAEL